MNRARSGAMVFVALATLSPYAQERIPAPAPQNGPRFDVVSIKRSQTKDTDTSWGAQPGGRWRMHNLAVSVLIREAFPVQANDLLGAPDWVTSDRYDIEARAEGNPTREQMRPMLQALLAERFQFAAHYETVERPVFALVVARADGRTRPGLVPSSIDCAAVAAARRENREPDVPAPANGARPCAWNASYGPDRADRRIRIHPDIHSGASAGRRSRVALHGPRGATRAQAGPRPRAAQGAGRRSHRAAS